jgi:hypothetical protein
MGNDPTRHLLFNANFLERTRLHVREQAGGQRLHQGVMACRAHHVQPGSVRGINLIGSYSPIGAVAFPYHASENGAGRDSKCAESACRARHLLRVCLSLDEMHISEIERTYLTTIAILTPENATANIHMHDTCSVEGHPTQELHHIYKLYFGALQTYISPLGDRDNAR